jgi:glycosyltransferase involved in cell wall biosynthesis
VSDVGAGREIVDDGETGWLIQPSLGSLTAALHMVDAHRASLSAMGQRGRRIAEERFDGAANDRRIVDAVEEAAELERGRAGMEAPCSAGSRR